MKVRSWPGSLAAAAALLLAGVCSARSEEMSPYRLRDVEVFGTDRVTPERIREKYGDRLKEFVSASGRSGKKAAGRASLLRQSLEQGVRELGGLPWVRLELAEVPTQAEETPVVLTFEAVEEADRAERLPFRPPPAKKTVPEPAGLLPDWQRYHELGWSLVKEAKIGVGRAPCPGFYCSWGGATPELKKLEDRFIEEAKDYAGLLETVLKEDSDPARRTQAMYVLSYLKDGSEVCRLAAYGLLDADESVRGAAFDIFNDIAIQHPELPLPLAQVIRLTGSPYAGDRDKALAVLVSVADRKEYRPMLVEALPKALAVLKLQHPTNHAVAHTLLRYVTEQNPGERNYAAWEEVIQRARASVQPAAPAAPSAPAKPGQER